VADAETLAIQDEALLRLSGANRKLAKRKSSRRVARSESARSGHGAGARSTLRSTLRNSSRAKAKASGLMQDLPNVRDLVRTMRTEAEERFQYRGCLAMMSRGARYASAVLADTCCCCCHSCRAATDDEEDEEDYEPGSAGAQSELSRRLLLSQRGGYSVQM
jgi:hypothetical protein